MPVVETVQKPHAAARDTIESIVVALILAFVFRAFIVEAFVIPTGSMAPTLYGAHGTILCKDCGTEFAYGLRDLADRRSSSLVGNSAVAFCPNCRHGNTNLKINDEFRNPESGDRILVLKWPYDLGIDAIGPQRWDVTVFKDPSDMELGDGVTNFIKRLVGLPNEVLMIVDGDVYTVPASELSPESLSIMEQLRVEKYEHRTRRRSGRLRYPPDSVLDELDGKARIARKAPVAQRSLWLPFYDHDRPPERRDEHQPRWEPVRNEHTGWAVSGRTIHYSGQESATAGDDALRLKGPAMRATCAYNVAGASNSPRPRMSNELNPPFVHDQRVSFVLTPRDAGGSVTVRLTKNLREFDATLKFDGEVLISEQPVKRSKRLLLLRNRVSSLKTDRPVEVSFEVVDFRLSMRVAGEEVLASSDDQSADGYFGPDLSFLRRWRGKRASRPRLIGTGQFDIAHLVVDRDVHYFLDGASNRLIKPWPLEGWGSAEYPILLRGHEYFMLGDNTAASKDSRLWEQLGPHLEIRGDQCQLGTVPRDQLIGKAFFVYWPSMQRVAWLNWFPKLSRWGVVPDVGRMRWIR